MPQMSPALTSTPRSSTPSAAGRRSHAERLTEALSQAYTRRHYVDLTITLRDQVIFIFLCFFTSFKPFVMTCHANTEGVSSFALDFKCVQRNH